jgi:hypothetical protein
VIHSSYGGFRDQDTGGAGVSGAGWPARYEIRLDGVLGARWSDWFGGLKVETEADETILSGTLSDQTALHGLLDKARDLGLSVTSVRRLPPEGPEEGEP